MQPSGGVLWCVEQHAAEDDNAHGGESHGDLVTTLEDLHGVDVLALRRLRDHDPNTADDKVHGVDGKREEHIAGLGFCGKMQRQAATQDHGCEDLPGDGFKEVRSAAGAVADVVAHEVGDDCRVPRVVLRDVGLHLAHHVRTNVGGLGVDAASELRKERDQRGAEAVAHEEERQLVQGSRHQHPDAEQQANDAQEHHGDNEDAAEGTGTQANCDCLLEGPGCCRGHADI
mmetsp:Transcript_79331/g.256915  ORF Transcript_79331/g.256915 Transcript_79331/m.256915 type:complete len:229 (+) Transcript_79331:1740-2426(+)